MMIYIIIISQEVSEWSELTPYTHYINDYAVEKFQLGHVAARPAQTLACTCTSWQNMWLTQLATQETRYLCCSFTHKSSQEKTPKVESPLSVEHSCITSTPESSSFAVTGLPHVYCLWHFMGSRDKRDQETLATWLAEHRIINYCHDICYIYI